MPRIEKEAVVLLTVEELSKALGIPFNQVIGMEWWVSDMSKERLGVRLTVRVSEEIQLKFPAPKA